jgi:hypothetical protein
VREEKFCGPKRFWVRFGGNVNTIEAIIEQVVEQTPGIRATVLLCRAARAFREISSEPYPDIPDAIDKMVLYGMIVEMNYTLEQSDYRIRSIYFPRGTKFV